MTYAGVFEMRGFINIRQVFVFAGFLTILISSLLGQSNELKDVFVCQDIEIAVTQAVPISLVHTRVAYEDECDLNVESGNSWFSITVAKYDTEAESERKFEFDFGLYNSDSDSDKYTKHLETNSFWNNARSYYKSTNSDQVVMLRYKTIVITLIGSDYELLLKLETILREIPFDCKLKDDYIDVFYNR